MSVKDLFANAQANTVLAPMAGYTDLAFRKLCHDYGAGLTVTEMISSKAIVFDNKLTFQMLKSLPDTGVQFCQIFGHEPQVMADSVKIDEMQTFDGVDINMGCPVRKIVSNGDGSALSENPTLASKCITAVKLALKDKPLSVKFRLGVDETSHAVDFAKMCRDSGADFITVHFRTRKQMYAGQADYTLLEDIANVGLPLFANGDVTTRNDYLQLTNRGAFGVAVGRGALGQPYVFSQIANLPFNFDVTQAVSFHARTLLQLYPDRVVANELKKHVAFYLKGKRNGKNVLIDVNNATNVQTVLSLVQGYFAEYPQYNEVTND